MNTKTGMLSLMLLSMAAMAGLAHAEDEAAEQYPAITVHGFGTLGAVYHDEDQVKFRRDVSQAGGARAGQLSFVQDSMLGVQLTARLSPAFEASVQGVSRQTADNDFDPQVSWAYLKYMPAEGLDVRLGRLGMEAYIQGDSSEIGYANLLVRQPIIFYPRTFDGFDAEVIRPLGDGSLRLKGFGGWTTGELISTGEPYDLQGATIFGGGVDYSRSGWTARIAFARHTTNHELKELQPGTPQRAALSATPNGDRILDKLSMQDRVFDLRSVALAYDGGRMQGMASYSEISSSQWSTHHLFYANMGYRFGAVTPYVSYSNQHAGRHFIPTGIPDGMSVPTDMLNQAALSAQAGLNTNQSTVALGVRYDFAENMALKFQVDRIHYKDPESIVDPSLFSEPALSRSCKDLTLLSVALDFVF